MKAKIMTYALIGIFTLLLLVGLNISRLGSHENVSIGYKTFYEKRLADSFLHNFNDPLYNAKASFSPIFFVHFIWSFIGQAWILWTIISAINAMLIWRLMQKHSVDELTASIAISLVILSPAFLAGNLANAAITISTFFALLFINYPITRYAIALILPFFGTEWLLLAIAYMALFSWSYIIFAILCIGFIGYILTLIATNTAFIFEIVTLNQFFADFGGLYGLTLFLIGFFLIGFFVLWHKSHKRYYIFTIIAIILSLFNQQLLIVATICASLYASLIIEKLIERKIDSTLLHWIQLSLIGIALFATCYFVAHRTMDSSPTPQEINAYQFLATQEFGNVLTQERNGYYVEYLAQKPTYPTPNLYLKSYEEQRTNATILFNTSNLASAVNELHNLNISYLFISPDMPLGSVWNYDLDGLLLPLKSERVFTKIYDVDGFMIYRINYDNATEELASKSE